MTSLLVGPPVFTGFLGLLDALGESVALSMAIPAEPALSGLRFHGAWVTLDPAAPSGVGFISRAWRVTVRN